MKDKKWLKEQIKHEEVDLKYAFDNYVPYEKVLIADGVNDLLNQLEEPEQEKVVIPQFVDEYIQEQDDPTFNMCVDYEMWGLNGDDGTTGFTKELAKWFDDNAKTYYDACLNGYSVEEEKLYQVLDKEGYVMMRKYKGGVVRVNATMKPSEYPYWQKEKLGLTEQEIKDYDERYWAFAVEVTE